MENTQDSGSGAASAPKEQRRMYPAICSDCGKPCEVPFEPSADKPVYCRDCFAKRRAPKTPANNPVPQMASRPQNTQQPKQQKQSPQTDINDIKRKLDVLTSKVDLLASIVRTISVAPKPAAETASEPKKKAVKPARPGKVAAKPARPGKKAKKK